MRTTTFPGVLSILVLATATAAQTTYVVDAAGGPGSQFTALPSAIAAASPGDILLLRTGGYTWTRNPVTKPLTIQGIGARVTIQGPTFGLGVDIAAIPAGRIFAIKDLEVSIGTTIKQCRGEILLDTVSLSFLTVNDSDAVTFRGRASNIGAVGSTLHIHNSRFGGNWVSLTASRSKIEVTDSTIDAGLNPGHSPSPAITVNAFDSEIWLRGSTVASSLFVRGFPVVPVLSGDATSRLHRDPQVQLISASGPAVRGFGRGDLVRNLPTLRNTDRPVLGQAVRYEFLSPPGSPYAISVGLPMTPTPWLDGLLRIDPTSMIVLRVGRQSITGSIDLPVSHGTQPALRGFVFQMQAVSGLIPQISNPIAISLR